LLNLAWTILSGLTGCNQLSLGGILGATTGEHQRVKEHEGDQKMVCFHNVFSFLLYKGRICPHFMTQVKKKNHMNM
jgi:hypothetical protein